MADKVLNLKLIYKNKPLDTASYKKDFTNRFFIGSDKNIFWQILDKAFPEKYELVSKRGDNFSLNLRQDMEASIIKDGQTLNHEELRQQNLIKGNSLRLDDNTEGSVTFNNVWAVEYFFKEPRKYTRTPEEIALHSEFAKSPPLSREERFTRIFIILGLVFTIIGLYIGEATYVPPKVEGLEERLQRIDDFATRVQPEIEEEPVAEVTPQEGTEEKPEEEKEVQETPQEITSEDFKDMFGIDLGTGEVGDADISNEILEITQVDEIVAATTNTEPGGGPGTGPGTGKPGGSTVLDDIASTTDIGTGEGLGDLGGLDDLDLGGTSGFEDVDMASLGGDIGDYTITKIKSQAHFDEQKKRFAGIMAVKEGSIKLEEMTPEAKTELANITQQVNTYKPQINRLYTVQSMMMDMYGSLEIEIIIEDNSSIVAVNFIESDGSFFTESFLQEAQQMIMKWKIKVKKAIIYSFRMKFQKL